MKYSVKARIALILMSVGLIVPALLLHVYANPNARTYNARTYEATAVQNASDMLKEGKETFRFDTFESEDFWGNKLRLHQAIAGEKLGGVGPGVSPKKALELGLKVDAEALPKGVVDAIKQGKVNLD